MQPGDMVWLMTPQVKKGLSKKISLRYTGPYYITTKVGQYTFMLRHHSTNRVLTHPVNGERLKRFVDRRDYSSQFNDSSDATQNYTVDETTRPTTSTAVESNDADDSDWYPVTRILATKTKGEKKYFKVEWEDTKSKPTWVQEDDVTDSLK